jgi:hypothetical protein
MGRQGERETGRKLSSPCLPASLSPYLPASLSPYLPASLSSYFSSLMRTFRYSI